MVASIVARLAGLYARQGNTGNHAQHGHDLHVPVHIEPSRGLVGLAEHRLHREESGMVSRGEKREGEGGHGLQKRGGLVRERGAVNWGKKKEAGGKGGGERRW